jgi:hypothetical protein
MPKIICLGLYLGYIALLIMHWNEYPTYNRDTISYVGAALSYDEKDITTLHHEAYQGVLDAVPENKRASLLSKTPHDKVIAERPDVFAAQLNGYHAKPLFVAGINVLHKLGLNLVFSARLLAIVPAIGLAVLILIWLSRYYTIGYSCLLSFLSATGAGIQSVELFSTPDMLSAALLVLGLYFLLEQRRPTAGAMLLVLSVFAQMDNIILVNLIFCYFALFAPRGDRLSLVQFGVFGIAATASYLAIGYLAQADNWATMFHYAFGEFVVDPANKVYSITPGFYFETLARQFSIVLTMNPIKQTCLFAGLGIITVLLHRNRPAGKMSAVLAGLVITVMMAMVIRYLSFPLLEERYYFAEYMIISLLFLRQVAETALPTAGSAASRNISGQSSNTATTWQGL